MRTHERFFANCLGNRSGARESITGETGRMTVDTTPTRHAHLDTLTRLPITIAGSDERVICLPFALSANANTQAVVDMVEGMPDDEVQAELDYVVQRFSHRHINLAGVFEEHYADLCRAFGRTPLESAERRQLIGAYFTSEYSIEAAALFNPSIVPHPDQSGLEEGELRFVMSLRATGEGHLSSAVFHTGVIRADQTISLDPQNPFSSRTRLAPDQYYIKPLLRRKLADLTASMDTVDQVLSRLDEQFTLRQLESVIAELRQNNEDPNGSEGAFENMLWLARSNYQVSLPPDANINDLILFPTSENEIRGIEDTRLVQFHEYDGETTYYGTFSAYNGQRSLTMLLETSDFRSVGVHTLNGACVRNKGMALFPRRINGHYTMCSRIDGRNLYIMYSDFIHFWESAQFLAGPKHPWEYQIMGNCGSPVETSEGWILLTHGVGPMREYSIGALLLDLDNPLEIRGRLKQPLQAPLESERDGYVPNVVYTCGYLLHQDHLYIPYAMADEASSIARVETAELIERLLEDGP